MQEKHITCLNGRFMQAGRAAVPVTDRGFRFGDGVFETIRLHHGVPYQWELHLTRLMLGLAALRIAPPLVDWQAYARKVIHKNAASEGFLRIAVSRGTGSRGYAPYPANMPATWVIEYLPPVPLPTKPLNLWLSTLARVPLQCLPANQKLAQGVNNTLALLEAQDHQCDEALQLTTHGHLCETASANLFWLKNDTLYTPSLDMGCLNGTTRDALLRLSPIPIRTVQEGIQSLKDAELVFLSNSRLGVWPVASLLPLQWQFATTHPLLRQLSAILERDRSTQAKTDEHRWGKAA